ncbi:hydroxyisourate hydrolase [Ferrovibrio sp.]|uniref:hydroxyisourate hydrolase n=1 Tax=Ferrovibrio sp. TaxID=1917215 RepID=UPI003D11EC98
MSKAGGISIHGVDVARGMPAKGLHVELHRLAPDTALLADGALAANGALDHATARGDGITAGEYEVRFHVGAWLKAQGGTTGILDVVPFRFTVAAPEQHYHLPFKFTPWGFSLFRGS